MDYRGEENGIECPQEQTPRILIVDDHPLSCRGIELSIQILSQKGRLPHFSIYKALSLIEAFDFLILKSISFDIIFLDICMEPFPEKKLFSGEDLGRLIIEKHPKTKILVLTSLSDKYRLAHIFKELNPDGFLIKSEVNETCLVQAIQGVLNGRPSYSPTILKLLRDEFVSSFKLNQEEKDFLYLLSKGIPSKEIPEHLPWSLSKVEKQKQLLREKLMVEKSNVLALVYRAKDMGII